MSDQQTPPGGNQPNQGSQNPYAGPQHGQQPGQQQGPPQQYGSYQQEPSGGAGLAITALILGILSLFGLIVAIGGFLFGIPAIIVGAIASRKAKRGQARGRGLAITGIVTGVIGVLLNLLAIVGLVALFNSGSGQTYLECANQAQNQSEIQQCADEFGRNLQN